MANGKKISELNELTELVSNTDYFIEILDQGESDFSKQNKRIKPENLVIANDSITAQEVSYDNTLSGLAATNVQDALDSIYECGCQGSSSGGDSGGTAPEGAVIELPKQIWLDTVDGSDITGAVGRADLPFKSMEAINDTIFVDGFTDPGSQSPNVKQYVIWVTNADTNVLTNASTQTFSHPNLRLGITINLLNFINGQQADTSFFYFDFQHFTRDDVQLSYTINAETLSLKNPSGEISVIQDCDLTINANAIYDDTSLFKVANSNLNINCNVFKRPVIDTSAWLIIADDDQTGDDLKLRSVINITGSKLEGVVIITLNSQGATQSPKPVVNINAGQILYCGFIGPNTRFHVKARLLQFGLGSGVNGVFGTLVPLLYQTSSNTSALIDDSQHIYEADIITGRIAGGSSDVEFGLRLTAAYTEFRNCTFSKDVIPITGLRNEFNTGAKAIFNNCTFNQSSNHTGSFGFSPLVPKGAATLKNCAVLGAEFNILDWYLIGDNVFEATPNGAPALGSANVVPNLSDFYPSFDSQTIV